MLDQEIKEVFGTEAKYFNLDDERQESEGIENERKTKMKGMTFQEHLNDNMRGDPNSPSKRK